MFRVGKDAPDPAVRPAVASVEAAKVARPPEAAPPVARPQVVAARQDVAPVTVRVPAAATPPRPVPAPVRPPEAVAAPPVAKPVVRPPATAAAAQPAMLVAGPGVILKGSMQCDVLRVEGNIEGDVKARKLMILAGGTLVGTAEIEDAEIEGHFEGTLTVANHLIVRSSGRLTGKFQYGEIEIERGGAISGEIQTHGSAIAAEPEEAPLATFATRVV
jgi:cytoskeletal protein CcmA (bactofilin family)